MAANTGLAPSGLLDDRGAGQHASPKLKILALSSTFPNALQPGLGTFVRARLDRVTAHADVRVIAPVDAGRRSSITGEFVGERFTKKLESGSHCKLGPGSLLGTSRS